MAKKKAARARRDNTELRVSAVRSRKPLAWAGRI